MRRRNPEVEGRWRARLKEMAAEGLSVSQYAKRSGLNVKRVYYWRRRLEQLDQVGAASAGGEGPGHSLVEVARVLPSPPQSGLEVRVAGRYSVSIRGSFQSSTLRSLLDVLEDGQ